MDCVVVVLGGTCLESSRQGVVVPGTTISVSSFLSGGCFRWVFFFIKLGTFLGRNDLGISNSRLQMS